MKIFRLHSANYAKRMEDLFKELVGPGILDKGDSENEITFKK